MTKNPAFVRETVRRWLSGVRDSESKMKAMEDRIIDYRARLELLKAVDYSSVSVSTSTVNDMMGEAIATLEAMEVEWGEHVAHAAADIADAYRVMDGATMAGYAVCLHDLMGMRWEDVAAQISYSVQAVYIISERGYVELYDAMPEYWRREVFPKAI